MGQNTLKEYKIILEKFILKNKERKINKDANY